ncbi:MAG: hypothetical protein ACTIJ9_14340 [Aequorivita sp.]
MKKLILSTAIVLGGLTAVTAQSDKKEITAMNEKQQTVSEAQVEKRISEAQDVKSTVVEKGAETKASATKAVQDFKEIKSTELPKAVQEAVATDFEGASISKAYVNSNGDYKIQLATADAKQATVYANEKGEWIKSELKKQ